MWRRVSLVFAFVTGLACSSEDGSNAGNGGTTSGGASGGTTSGGATSGGAGKASSGSGGQAGATAGKDGTGGNSAGSSGSSAKGGTGNAGSGQAAAGSGESGGGGGSGTDTAGNGGSTNGGLGGGAGSGGNAGEPGTPSVRVVGRTTPGTMGGQRLSWAGTNFHARFSGTQISMQLADGGNKNEFAVVIDGDVTKVATTDGTTTYSLATGLEDTTHDIVVWRRSESYYNPSEFIGFTGFSEGGALLAPAPAPERRIEIIGDSITVGYGNEGTQPCSANQSNGNNYVSYGSVAARMLEADLVTIAWSGIGMYRNYDQAGPSADAMPARYDKIIPTDSGAPTWDFSKYVPQAVVINLGTNDYSTRGDPGQPYVDAYIGFLNRVRDNYPDAYIFCLIPLSAATANVNAAVDALKADGDEDVEAFDISVTGGANDGCDGHPNVARDQAMGEKLAGRMATVMGWD